MTPPKNEADDGRLLRFGEVVLEDRIHYSPQFFLVNLFDEISEKNQKGLPS